jgi:hypothetical protein
MVHLDFLTKDAYLILLDAAMTQLEKVIRDLRSMQGNETSGLSTLTEVEEWVANVRKCVRVVAKDDVAALAEIPVPVIERESLEGWHVLSAAITALEGVRLLFGEFRLHYLWPEAL